MSTTVRVLVVGTSDPRRDSVAAGLSAAGFETETATTATAADAVDCLVGVPPADRDVKQFATELADGRQPAILYTDRSVAEGSIPTDIEAVVSREHGDSEMELAARVRELSGNPLVADGGTGIEQAEFPLERLHEIATDRELSRSEKIDALLTAGKDRLGTSDAFLTRIEGDTQEVIRSVGEHPELTPGTKAPLSEAYCQYTIDREEPLSVRDAESSEVIEEEPYDRFGLRCYLGTTIHVNGDAYGTVCFVDTEPGDSEFDAHERTFLKVLTDWISYLLEQQVYERELDQQRAFTESLMDSLPDPLYATGEAGRVRRWNSRFEETIGSGEIEGRQLTEFVTEDDRAAFEAAISRALSGEQSSVEAAVETGDEKLTPFEFSSGPLRDETGAITGVAGVGRDITERQRQRERLSGILDTTRSLMQARDRDHVAEIAVNAAKELLGFDIGVFRLYNSDERTLEPAAATEETIELLGERPVYAVGEGSPGEVFASGEPRIIDDLSETDLSLGELGSAMYYPVGVHGTMSICATERAAFDETDQQMLALLATSAAAACMRAKREQDVREAQEHTERVLDRVNGLVQDTVEVLVQATTREELEDGVVNQLSNAPPYTFAWIGHPDIASETLSPTAWAGEASLPIGGRSFDLDSGDDPVSLAFSDETPQVLPDLAEGAGVWSELTADSPAGSLIAIPLVYKDANYGVLSVFAAESEEFDERERIVLESLGRVIANAINAIERGRILDATEIIELEFAINDQDLFFSRLSAAAECQIESAGTDYLSDGRVRLYLTATGIDGEAFESIVTEDVAVEDVTLIADHDDECLLEVVVEESLLSTLTEYGAVPREVRAENGDARFTVELPYEAEARELFELVETQYPTTELLGYHERERAVETRQEFKAALGDRFTDRQETALRTAYLGGFFDWPREVDGNELAEAMGIARPTYHQHLRAAQKKVFEELFE